MSDKLVTPPETAEAGQAKHEEKAWRPRIDTERVVHGFEGKTPEADTILESPEVRDPDEDTAPLQGSKDISDDDYLGGDE